MCTGHDSENYTDIREVTLSGYPRNVIPGKNGRFVVACHDLDAHAEEKRLAKYVYVLMHVCNLCLISI